MACLTYQDKIQSNLIHLRLNKTELNNNEVLSLLISLYVNKK